MVVPQIPEFIPAPRIASPASTAGYPPTGSPGQSHPSSAYSLPAIGHPATTEPSLSILESRRSISIHTPRSDGTREVEVEVERLDLPAIRQFEQTEFDLQYEYRFEGKDQAQMSVILETGRAVSIVFDGTQTLG